MSPKRRARNAATKPGRIAFLQDMDYRCCLCGTQEGVVGVHEIARGSGIRDAALSERCAWLPACWTCNSGPLNDYGQWPLVQQIALKMIVDPEWYDLDKVNALRWRVVGAIEQKEIDRVLEVVRARVAWTF